MCFGSCTRFTRKFPRTLALAFATTGFHTLLELAHATPCHATARPVLSDGKSSQYQARYAELEHKEYAAAFVTGWDREADCSSLRTIGHTRCCRRHNFLYFPAEVLLCSFAASRLVVHCEIRLLTLKQSPRKSKLLVPITNHEC